jgi:hypothetical protein
VLLCLYDYQNGITNEEKDIIFATKPKLFSIKTINLPKTIQYVKTTNVEIMDTSVKTSNSKLKSGVQITDNKKTNNIYELEVVLEDMVYIETYYSHQLGNAAIRHRNCKWLDGR